MYLRNTSLWAAVSLLFISKTWAQEIVEISEPIVVEAETIEVLPLPLDPLSTPLDRVEISEINLEEGSTLVIPAFKSVVIEKVSAAEGSKIQFAHSSSEEGVDGANSRFFIGEIKGHILIEARGGDGRNGRDGRHGRQGLDGERGRNARTLLFGLIYLSKGEDGRSGHPGEDGEDAEDGESGGSGGEISFYYKQKTSDSKILVDVDGGAGGIGGKPGMGGLGGNGGPAGKGWPNGRQGPMGVSGKTGKPGRAGSPGEPGRASVYQVSENLYRCLFSLDARSQVEELVDEDYDLCRLQTQRNARSRDSLVIQANSLIDWAEVDGVIYISSDGKDGRDARDAWASGTSAELGSAGSEGGQITIFVQELPQKAMISARGGKGGRGGFGARGAKGWDGHDGRNAGLFRSSRPGEDGTDGTNGGNGSDGSNGAAGGHIRVIYIPKNLESYERDWDSRFEFDVSGGEAGVAGRGAPGGKGGLGGKGGKHFWSNKREADGRNGVDGLNGVDGHDGLAGEEGQVELFEADSMIDWIIEEFRAQSLRFND